MTIQRGTRESRNSLKQVILALNELDKNEKRTDEYKDSDLKSNLRGTFESMTFNITKLYSFFANGKWEVVDQNILLMNGKKDLKKIKNLYDIN